MTTEYAKGGYVSGDGSGPMMLKTGEYLIPPSAARRYVDLLRQINQSLEDESE